MSAFYQVGDSVSFDFSKVSDGDLARQKVIAPGIEAWDGKTGRITGETEGSMTIKVGPDERVMTRLPFRWLVNTGVMKYQEQAAEVIE